MSDAQPPLAFLDVALVYDPARRRADLALDADGNLLMDTTPATPMLIALGSNRRALPEDELPTGEDLLNSSGGFARRRGWIGDAVDGRGDRIGSRLWLLDREKESELTLRRAELYAREAFGWVEEELGRPAEILVAWGRAQVLRISVRIGETRLAIAQRLGGV